MAASVCKQAGLTRKKAKSSRSAASIMLGKASLGQKNPPLSLIAGAEPHKPSAAKRINVSHFNSSSSLQNLNSSSTVNKTTTALEPAAQRTAPRLLTAAKKHEAGKKTPRASSLLGQAATMPTIFDPMSPSSVRDDIQPPTAEEEVIGSDTKAKKIDTLPRYFTLTTTAHPCYPDMPVTMAVQAGPNAENANNNQESQKEVRKLPRTLARAISCQDYHEGAESSNTTGVRAAAAKPTTKCELT